ncbi:MAG: transporter substrate-binding protein [Sphaerisporangium sp.]|nr:transporter substrate-binding protein [Sphaerisporangium sp.]
MLKSLRSQFLLGSSVLLVVGLTTACGSNSQPSSTSTGASGGGPETLDSVCAAGAKEGQVSFWSGVEPDMFNKEIVPFKTAHPKIEVKFTYLQPQDQIQRALAELQAGRALDVDAISPDSATALTIFQAKAVEEADLSKLGVDPSLAVDIQGTKVFTTQRTYGGIAYNSNLVKAADLPDTWEGLVDPKYAGKISVDPRGKWLAPLAAVWGEQKTVAWYKKLIEVAKPVVVSGVTGSLTKVISAEIPITTSGRDAETAQMKASGAPVAIKYLDVIPETNQVALLLKHAQHPNAAKCFLAWKAGKDGQAAQLATEFKGNSISPEGMPSGSKVASVRTPEDLTLVGTVGKQFSAMTAG